MEIIVSLIFLAYFILYAFAFALPALPFVPTLIGQTPLQKPVEHDAGRKSNYALENWLEREEEIALDRLLANVAPGGRNARDAAPGSVIASPSRDHPNYYFQWVRDAAITLSTLVDLYAEYPDIDPYDSPNDSAPSDIPAILEAYAHLQKQLQHASNPSGSFYDLSGLGEPKFHADGSAFTESWGRPQRDGPALRALTLIAYLRAHNASHPALWDHRNDDNEAMNGKSWFDFLYAPTLPAHSVIKADLEYVSNTWHLPGFDLWEEITGLHFFTAMVQRRALLTGAEVAAAFNDPGAAAWYQRQAAQLGHLLPQFWDGRKGHLVETITSPSRSGLDCALLLGALHGTPATNASFSEDIVYAPHSDEVLISLLHLTRDAVARYPINHRPDDGAGHPPTFRPAALGRYPEDMYDGYGNVYPQGGNPWFLCTASAAEVAYRTAARLQETQHLTVTPRGSRFWEELLGWWRWSSSSSSAGGSYRARTSRTLKDAPPHVYLPGQRDGVFEAAVRALLALGDGYLAVLRAHVDAAGAMSEQFSRWDGFETGARDLTWSYGAFLGAVGVRERVRRGLGWD